MFINRKKIQQKTDGFTNIHHWSVIRDQHKASLMRMIQLLRAKLLMAAGVKFTKWFKYTKYCRKRYEKGLSRLTKFISNRTELSKVQAMHQTLHFTDNIIRITEKLEAAHALRHRSLLSEIITMVSRDTIEKLTTTAAPYKFTQNKILKKNGYKYLGLLLRKTVRKRTLNLFNWYQRHTRLIRHANFVGELMDRSMKQRA